MCNLNCKYCYYLEKSNISKDAAGARRFLMDDSMLELFIERYINSQSMPQVLFTWHGGESLMRPLSFYRRVVELQRKYARGRVIDNCIQTKGAVKKVKNKAGRIRPQERNLPFPGLF